jgi:mycofactocin precursor
MTTVAEAIEPDAPEAVVDGVTDVSADDVVVEDVLVEEVSIDGMCGVY